MKYSVNAYQKLKVLYYEDYAKIFPNDWNRNERLWKAVYEGHLEGKERFAIKKYLLIIGKKKNMQVLSHTFTYFST